jgi:hypothetical protein
MVDFAIGFRTALDNPLFICSTAHTNDHFQILPGIGKFACEIESLPLSSGTYFLNLQVSKGLLIFDWIGRAHKFDVKTIDYFGTGSDISVGHSPFLIKSKWLQG